MPITITLPQASGSWIGPGATVLVQSDFTGPLPADTQWDYHVHLGSDATPVWEEFVFRNQNPDSNVIMVKDARKSSGRTQDQPVDEQPVRLVVELRTSSGVLDQGSVDTTWSTTRGLGQQSFLQPQVQAAEGFTAQDRVLLQATESRSQLLGELGDLVIQTASGPVNTTLGAIFSRKTLDQLTLQELTSGETCDPVRVTVSGTWFHAIIVRTTTIAPDLVAKTPDHEWYFPDLAVLRVFRGADLEFRRGIHTPTFIQEKPWQWGWAFLNVVPILGPPPDTTIAVDWREGCCGQVFGMFLN